MMASADSPPQLRVERKALAFTLVELMVSMVVLSIVGGVVFSMTSATGKIWKTTSTKIEAFHSARSAFESMTRNLTQATLNTYWDYFDAPPTSKPLSYYMEKYQANPGAATLSAVTNFEASTYDRQSELHFICGPASAIISANADKTWSADNTTAPVRPTHAVFYLSPNGYTAPAVGSMVNPLQGLDRLLNAGGYYVEFNSDRANRPKFLANNLNNVRHRYRLMQLTQPSDRLSIYDPAYAASKGSPTYSGWFNDALKIPPRGVPGASRPDAQPIAENIIALIIQPKRSIAEAVDSSGKSLAPVAPNYLYDSRNADAPSSPPTTNNLQRSQLPPLLQVTMVAIDETSAIRLAAQNGINAPDLASTTAITGAYTGFTDSTKFSSNDRANPLDLEMLEESLVRRGITYRVFTTNVLIRGAKWSEN